MILIFFISLSNVKQNKTRHIIIRSYDILY